MKKSIKVTIAVLAILIGVVTLIFYYSRQIREKQFQLVDYISETDIAYQSDFIELLNQAIQYNSEVEKSIANNIALNALKSTLSKSGLKLENTFITYSYSDEKYASFYAEIIDTILFEDAFKKLSAFYNIRLFKEDSELYISGNTAISIEKHAKYVKLNFGNGALNALTDIKSKPSLFFKNLLKNSNLGILNTTGTPTIDSLDYATFSYSYTKELNLTIDWKVAQNHPVQLNSKSDIELYPTQKKTVKAFTNIDIEQLISALNPFLKGMGTEEFEKLPLSAKELLRLWNGKSSFQMGGKSAQETIQLITEFDDDFNQVERKIVKIDSIPNIGFYWGTFQPKESLILLYKLPNIESDNKKLQIALLPSLITKLDEKSIKASSQISDYRKATFNQLLQLNVDIPGIIGEINAEKTSTDNLRVTIKLKDWQGLRNPKKIDISNFW